MESIYHQQQLNLSIRIHEIYCILHNNIDTVKNRTGIFIIQIPKHGIKRQVPGVNRANENNSEWEQI